MFCCLSDYYIVGDFFIRGGEAENIRIISFKKEHALEDMTIPVIYLCKKNI